MKKITSLLFVVFLAPILQAETFKVDFGNSAASNVQSGSYAYYASHEVPATFSTQTYGVFGSTVSVTPTWAPGAVAAAMQMMDRGTQSYEDATEDLMRDWIGTDTRSAGDPLTLTIGGLPAGTYTWTSYHHDTSASNMGKFDVTVNDAIGSVTTTNIQITGNAVKTFAGVATFTATILSNGIDDITLVFDQRPYTTPLNQAWFIMNGFELTRTISGDGRAHSPNPANGSQLNLRDVTFLSWEGSNDPDISSIDQYDLVFGINPDMANNTIYPNVTPPVNVASLGGLNDNTRYYWRVDSHITWDSAEVTGNLQEVVEGDAWSFWESNGLRRPISPEQPMWLVHIDTWNYADPQKIIELIPQDIRPYVVMNISISISHDVTTGQFEVAEYGYEVAKSWVRACAENNMWCMVQQSSGGMHQFSENDLSVYEEFYREYPNFIGFNYCEQFWGFDDPTDPASAPWTDRIQHFADLLALSHRYGGYLVVSWCGNQWSPNINPIAMLKRIPNFAQACRDYTENYILCEKFTTVSYKLDMESLCLGAYLSGYSGQYGIRYDSTGWRDASGTTGDGFTLSTGGAPQLEHMMLTGETVVDAPELIWQQCFRELSRGSTTNNYNMRRWGTYPQFDNVSVDLFRKVLDGTVRIPTRQEVIDRTKVVIINNVNSGSSDDIYSSPETLFQGLYRLDSDGNYSSNFSFFKKTGRYPTIPVVYQLHDADAQSFQVQVNKSSYSTRWPNIAAKQSEFNSLFPSEYTGDIYAGRHENGWVVYNPYKTGVTANGTIPFKYNTCNSMELTLSQYTSGVVKEYADQVTFYLENYDNDLNLGMRTDTIKIYGSTSEPTYSWYDRGSHSASTVTKSWSAGVFTLTVQHNGPLDITVNCAGTATGRLTDYTPAVLAAPAIPLSYPGPLQYEGECFDYKSISSIVTSGYSYPVRYYTGQGYLLFGTNSAAAVRDSVKVLQAGVYRLETRYSVTGPTVNTIDLYVNGSYVATPSFIPTATLSNWAVNTQTINLNAGTNTIEFRARTAAPSSVYFDNIVVVPTVYAGNGISIQENSAGFVSVEGTIDNTESGYTGDGYANTNDAAGAGVDWEMAFDASATKALTFQYACPDHRMADLIVNGQTVASDIPFPSTGSWSVWGFVTVYAKTDTGVSSVRLESTSSTGLPHIDCIEVVGILPVEAPEVPTGLNATAAASTGQIDLTWDASLGAMSYNVKRSETEGGPYTTIATVEETDYSDTNLPQLTTYYYVISGVNSAGESADSTQSSATTANLAPAAPTNLIATAGGGSITLDWTDNAEGDLDSYNVYRSTTSGSYGVPLATEVAASTYVDSTAANDVVYYYTVTSVDTVANESDYSNVGSAMLTDGNIVLLSTVDFESGFGDWQNITEDTADWLQDSGGTLTTLTGPASGANGSTWYAYLETSPSGAGKIAILQSPVIRGYKRTLSFYYHMYGAEMGALNVDVNDDGAWHDAVWSLSGQQHTSESDEYTQATLDLTGYSGPITIRFRGVGVTGSHGDMAIDDIVVTGGLLYGDMDGNTIVDTGDLPELMGYWLQTDCVLDLDGDCIITLYEFSEFAHNWLDDSYQ